MRPPVFPALAAAIAVRGWTQVGVADKLGVHVNSVNQILRGQLTPSAKLRARFAELFDIDENVLFELNPDLQRLIESAVAQGFGRVVEDPNVLRRVATLTRGGAGDAQSA